MKTGFQARPRGGSDCSAGTAAVRRRRRLTAAVLCLSFALGSCSSFSNFVSDNWPTWAGGMPKDVPPRPGQPGYEEFVAHGRSSEAQQPPVNATGSAPAAMPAGAAAPAAAAFHPQAVPPNPPPAPAVSAAPPTPAGDRGVQGGLY